MTGQKRVRTEQNKTDRKVIPGIRSWAEVVADPNVNVGIPAARVIASLALEKIVRELMADPELLSLWADLNELYETVGTHTARLEERGGWKAENQGEYDTNRLDFDD